MNKPKTKLIKIKTPPVWQYESGDGAVMVYACYGDKLTLERINFLLSAAKHELMQEINEE